MTTMFHQKPNLYISHVQIKVSNIARSIDFYTSIIGFQVLAKTDEAVYLTVDGKHSLVSLVEVSNAMDPSRFAGLYHMALLLPTRIDLGNILQHFSKHNVSIGAGDHHVSEALYLNDPDGNGIEIYADRDENYWKWLNDGQIYMTTDQVDVKGVLAEADGNWKGLPEKTVMGHIHLAVSHLKKAEKFYTEILDYDIVTQYGSQALFVSTGKYHHHIGMNTWHTAGAEPTAENSTGLKSYTIVLKDIDYANQVKAKLELNGYPVNKIDNGSHFGGTPIFSTTDSSGLTVSFTIEGI